LVYKDVISFFVTNYPVEKYIELERNPYLLGRITIHHVKEDFHAEVDIIYQESHKIFKHIDIVYRQYSAEEALIIGVQRLRTFLEKIENNSGGNANFNER
jgi:serine phosphatase RsbU (regulator of sigma subunit)